MKNEETICAIATAQGGAIGIIRVSGPEAVSLTDLIFTPANGKPLAVREPYTVAFGHVTDNGGNIVDEVLVSLFRAPHSYTGEDSTEISCHGSPYILRRVLRLLIDHGCRAARPGEFTQRAFLNGKMDLSQAEAVADLIASQSEAQHRLAMSQMRGGFSRQLADLRARLLHLTSLMELELDFADHEELEFADRTELQALADQIERLIARLADSFATGNALKNGIPVAIVGETNAGKSTLLNALLNEEKAIVSDIHGTTRDTIEDTVDLRGITFRFIDTAGIRETNDTIENLGIERSFRAIDGAQIVILVCDATRGAAPLQAFFAQIAQHLQGKTLVLARNKCDLPCPEPINVPAQAHVVNISAKEGNNLSALQDLLVELAALPAFQADELVVTNARHYEALVRALQSIRRVQEGLSTNLSGDFISQDLRECLFHLGDIVGEVTTDEVLGNIFEHFCVGK